MKYQNKKKKLEIKKNRIFKENKIKRKSYGNEIKKIFIKI